MGEAELFCQTACLRLYKISVELFVYSVPHLLYGSYIGDKVRHIFEYFNQTTIFTVIVSNPAPNMRTSACNETNIITLAWAVPVDAPSLGARLEAYAETRAASHIFTLCVKHAVGSRMGQLPPEIVQNVCSALWDSAFDAKIEDWRKAHACLSNACKTFDHFSEDALEGLKEDFLAVVKGEGLDVLTVDERFREWLEDMGMCTDRHEEVVLEHVYKLRATLCEHTKSTMYKRGQQVLSILDIS